MAGHSKWNNIKNKKQAADAKRGKVFSQVAKQIRVATKEGASGDPQHNPALRTALEKARAANMPKDKIAAAIDKGLGKTKSGVSIARNVYEGFGPGGVGVIVTASTDNAQRTSADVKFVFSRAGGSLAGPGSAAYLFTISADNETYTPKQPMQAEPDVQSRISQMIDAFLELDDVDDVFVSITLEEGE